MGLRGRNRCRTKFESLIILYSSEKYCYNDQIKSFHALGEINDCNTRREGHAVAQLVEALRYKPENRGIDSRWCHWNFSLT